MLGALEERYGIEVPSDDYEGTVTGSATGAGKAAGDRAGTGELPKVVLDCMGLQCPEPILVLAKAARNASGPTLFEVVADDDAFPLDLKSWCKSAGATIRGVEEVDGVFKAVVTVGPRAEIATSSRLRRASNGPFVALPEASLDGNDDTQDGVIEVDCLGLRCPEPIMRIARRVRDSPAATTFRVLADDDAFPVDIEAWCRSANARLKVLDKQPDGHYAAVIVTQGSSKRGPTEITSPVVPARSTAPNFATREESTVSFALPGVPWESVEDRLDAISRLGGALVSLECDDELTTTLLNWCEDNDASVGRFETQAGGTLKAELRVTTRRGPANERRATLVRAADSPDQNRCALLILNNDHEALLAAMLVANGAIAQGMEVVIFFSFWGLNLLRGDSPRPEMPRPKVSWSQRLFKWLMPAGPRRQPLSQLNFGGAGRGMLTHIMKDKNIMTLPQLMASVEAEGARYIACTMSMEVMGISERDLAPRPNLELGGVAVFVEQARNAQINMVF